ncbi:hypothetical protein WMG39_32955, partial [Microcoleus anatoxicus PTRS2]
GSDPDGTIASYTIDTLPNVAQGVLFLGDPANGGVAVTPGRVLTPAQISQLFFKSTGAFTGANFNYRATDDKGLSSPAAATVAEIVAPTPTPTPVPTPTPTPVNQPPVTNNTNAVLAPNSTLQLPGLGGSDPDGTIAS